MFVCVCMCVYVCVWGGGGICCCAVLMLCTGMWSRYGADQLGHDIIRVSKHGTRLGENVPVYNVKRNNVYSIDPCNIVTGHGNYEAHYEKAICNLAVWEVSLYTTILPFIIFFIFLSSFI